MKKIKYWAITFIIGLAVAIVAHLVITNFSKKTTLYEPTGFTMVLDLMAEQESI
ncbi:hypothetical protein [Flagellimonas sp. CMM7]|uniref:hypothetical protein n=1 Tax=Flagellimonas sp. CMM7 TaxID=2654676 RepID=UPI0013D25A7B|nr:hypothetical protein [Flagellimonas sp. CMM7]UII81073.1 hypothetical protein LV704_06045 [Flagellimonas sp. CMM7]